MDIRAVTIASLLLIFLLGCNSEYKEEIDKGNKAMQVGKYEEALEAFGKANTLDPNNPEIQNLLEDARDNLAKEIEDRLLEERKEKIKKELREYVSKVMYIQTKFVEVFGKENKTEKDVDYLHSLTIKADFTPPEDLFDLHMYYIKFLQQHYKSANYYVSGVVNNNEEDFERAVEEMENASNTFTEYKNLFTYYLDINELKAEDVGWTY
jgi:tetratricopeptide (TPR) repeat protein